VGDGLLHHARRLHDLRKEHLAGPEEVADHVHPVHQGPLDDLDGAPAAGLDLASQLLGVSLDVIGHALDQRMGDPLADRQVAPLGDRGLDDLALAVVRLGDLEQALGGVGATVQDHVLDAGAQLGLDLVVHDQRTGVDDAHVEARLDRVEQEHRVDGLAHRVVAPEREAHVRDPAGHLGAGQVGLDPPGGLDEVLAVRRVLLDAGRHREDVGVEDDVLGREADLVDQDPVRPLADHLAAFQVVGLTVLVEGHHHRGGAVLADQACLGAERLLALLHGDRVHDRLALHVLEAGLDHLPLGGVDHHGHPADVGLAGDQLGEAVHRGDAVDHALVHVDVDDLRTAGHLLGRDRQGLVVVAGLDQVAELRGAGDVRALADVDEQALGVDRERLEAGEPHRGLVDGRGAADLVRDGLGDRRDVRGRGAAAPADQVHEAASCELLDDRGGLLGSLVVLTEGVGQTRVGVAGHEAVGDPRHLRDVGTHLLGAQRAVQTHRERARVTH